MENFLNPLATLSSPNVLAQSIWFLPLFLILMIWSLIWKGLALWKSARRGDNIWFIVFLLVNTMGILEILYIYVFGKDKEKKNDVI